MSDKLKETFEELLSEEEKAKADTAGKKDDTKAEDEIDGDDDATKSEDEKAGGEEKKDSEGDDLKESEEKLSLSETVVKLFEGEELSDEFKHKVSVLVEAAVVDRIVEREAELKEDFDSKLVTIKESLAADVNRYLTYIAEEFVAENKVAIENNVKVELAESFLNNFKSLLAEHNVEVAMGKVDMVADLEAKCAELTESVNRQYEANATLLEANKLLERGAVLTEVSKELSENEKDHLGKLVEGLEFNSAEQFRSDVTMLKDKFFVLTESKEEVEEELLQEEVAEVKPVVASNRYHDALKQLKQ